MGFSVWSKPTLRPVNPLGGDTINRRAVCGRTACTVRRGEGPKPIGPSYPYHDVVKRATATGIHFARADRRAPVPATQLKDVFAR